MNCETGVHGDELLNLPLNLLLIESLSIRLLRGQGLNGNKLLCFPALEIIITKTDMWAML